MIKGPNGHAEVRESILMYETQNLRFISWGHSLTRNSFLQINISVWWWFLLWYTLSCLLLQIFKSTIITYRFCSPIGPNSLFWFWIFFWNFAMDKNWTWTFHAISTNLLEIKNLKIIQFWTIFFAFHTSNIEIQKTIGFLQIVNWFKIFECFIIKVFFARLSKSLVHNNGSESQWPNSGPLIEINHLWNRFQIFRWLRSIAYGDVDDLCS